MRCRPIALLLLLFAVLSAAEPVQQLEQAKNKQQLIRLLRSNPARYNLTWLHAFAARLKKLYKKDPAKICKPAEILLTAAQLLGNNKLLAEGNYWSGKCSFNRLKFVKARNHFQNALQLYESSGTFRLSGELEYLSGSTWFRSGNYPKAAIHYQRALINYKRNGQTNALQPALTALADALFYSSRIKEADQTYRYGLKLLQKNSNPEQEAYLTHSYGRLKYWTGEYDAALKLYLRAIRLYRKKKNNYGAAGVQTDLAALAKALGRYRLEKRLLLRAKQVFKKHNKKLQLANCLQQLADAAMRNSRWKKAEKQLQQALQLYRSVKNQLGEANSYSSLAYLYYIKKQYRDALYYTGLAVPLFRQSAALIGLGNIFYTKGLILNAMQQYPTAVVLFKQSIKLYEKANNKQNKLNSYQQMFYSLNKLQRNREALTAVGKALQTALFLRSRSGHAKRRIRIQEQTAGILKNMFIDTAVNNPWESLQLYEQFRGKTFMEQLQGRKALRAAGIPENEINRWHKIIKETARQEVLLRKSRSAKGRTLRRSIRRTLARLRSRLQSFEKRLAEKYPKYRSLKKPGVPSLNVIQKTLVTGEAAAVFCTVNNRMGIWLLTGNGKPVFTVIPWPQKNRATITALRQAVKNGEAYRKPAAVLFSELLAPFQTQLAKLKTLHIFADGELNIIPWTVVLSTAPQKLQKLRISMQSTLSAFTALRKSKSRNFKIPLLAFGGAFYTPNNSGLSNSAAQLSILDRAAALPDRSGDDEQWPDLPGSRAEAETVCRIWYPAQKKRQQGALFTGIFASEAAVKKMNSGIKINDSRLKLADARIIHFAVHGKADSSAAETSRLIFTRRKILPDSFQQQFTNNFAGFLKEDGDLYSAEIVGLNINADLVIMSACQTGLGKITGTEGVIGLTRAWFIAGAKGVVASLWNVSDIGTRVFMTLFHRQLANGIHPGVALQRTIKKMQNGSWRTGEFAPGRTFSVRGHKLAFKQLDLSAPSFWGAFQYWGR